MSAVPLPGRWHATGPPIEVHAHGEETPRRVALIHSDEMAGLLALFAEHGRPFTVEFGPDGVYRVEIEQMDARRSAAAGTDVPYEPARRRVSLLRSDQMGGKLADYAPHGDHSPIPFDPGARWRVEIQQVKPGK